MMYDFEKKVNAMKEYQIDEMRQQLRDVAKYLTHIECVVVATESVFSDDDEVELATDLEYAISRLVAVARLLRTRQRDREGLDDDDEDGHDGEEWKKPS